MMRKEESKRLSFDEQGKLKLLVAKMGINENSYKVQCPACKNSGSFSVTRKYDGVLYKCFRNKCGVSGFIPIVGFGTMLRLPGASNDHNSTSTASPKKAEGFPYKGEAIKIPKEVRDQLCDRYQILAEDILRQGWKYEGGGDRLVFPLYSYFGYRFGTQLKKLSPSSAFKGPKSMTYLSNGEEPIKMAFANYDKGGVVETDTIVLVEDIISATKISHLLPSCALLGTSLTDKAAGFLATHYKKVLIMLDPDAVDKALQISTKYNGLFDKIKVIKLEKDPKDTKQDILEEVISWGLYQGE